MDIGWVLRSLERSARLRVVSDEDLTKDVRNKVREFLADDPGFSFAKDAGPILGMPPVIRVSPARILHELGRATVFLDDSPFAQAARHWAHLRYCTTLASENFLTLSRYGFDVVHHHKQVQSEQLGIGLAIVVAKDALHRLHPGWEFTAVDADVALDVGFIKGVGSVRQVAGTKKRPDYFLVGRRLYGKGGAFKTVILECKGTHRSKAFVIEQLARASVQVRTVEIGSRIPTGFMIGSYLSGSEIVSYALDPPGVDEMWQGSGKEMDRLLGKDPGDRSWYPTIPEPATTTAENRETAEGETPEDGTVESSVTDDWVPGAPPIYQIPEEERSWFFRVLARTAAATALAFAGNTAAAAQLGTPRQRAEEDRDHQLLLDVQPRWRGDTTKTVRLADGLSFEGTASRMVLPDNSELEVFRGVESRLYGYLAEGRVGPYIRASNRLWRRWSQPRPSGNEVVSVGADGTALIVRRVR
ncbi:hypothetical protein AB0M02_17835 [Actinoplanes sp. NPDC051861]|uniref:hypothetical protein n=1 Tax=Actinoplanes sp. NPDC051861 TaxID=3155170 RepID=UPI00343E7A69